MAEFNREEIDYEDQLRQSERERKDLKNIIYELPVGLITVKGGNELTIDIANHEFCRMSGYELADFSMEKMSMAQLIHMEDYMMFEDAAEVCRRGKTSDEFEARIVTADQNVIWAMFQFQIYTYRSAVPYYLVSCWDITERKKMENEIMLVNERYHMLEEVSDDIVLDYDVKKQQFEIPECYLKFAEDKSVKYAGIEELYGAIHPDDRERFQKIFETALQREMKGTAEYRLRQGGKESGKYAYFRTCYQSIAEAGIWQVKYYLYYLKKRNVDGLHGVIDYPLLKKNVDVELSDEDCKKLDDIIKEIISVKNQEYPPKLEEKKICKKCAYYDLCFI